MPPPMQPSSALHPSAQSTPPIKTAAVSQAVGQNDTSKTSTVEKIPIRALETFKYMWDMFLWLLTYLQLAVLLTLAFIMSMSATVHWWLVKPTLEWLDKHKQRTRTTLKDWNKTQKWQTHNANTLIKEFKASFVEPCIEEIHIDRSIEVLCTYEWKLTSLEKDSGEKPAIYVPGFGNRFSAPSLPHRVKEDTGTAWLDQHLYRVFQQQFEPLFQALSVMNPSVRFKDVDVVIGRSNLLRLLGWVRGERAQLFNLHVKLIKETLFVHGVGSGRVPAQANSYGRNFEAAFTEATGEADTDGYHRAIRYALGPITLVVRLEVDAVLEDKQKEATDDLFHGYKTVNGPDHRAGIKHENATSVILGGCYVPHAALAELKVTRGSDEQLWAGHYSTNIVADRTSGGFGPTEDLSKKERRERDELIAKNKAEGKEGGYTTIYSAKPKDVRKQCSEWERHNEASVQKLTGLFSELIHTMKQVEGGKAVLRKESRDGDLLLYQGGEDMVDALPEEIVNIFWD